MIDLDRLRARSAQERALHDAALAAYQALLPYMARAGVREIIAGDSDGSIRVRLETLEERLGSEAPPETPGAFTAGTVLRIRGPLPDRARLSWPTQGDGVTCPRCRRVSATGTRVCSCGTALP